MTPKIKTTNQSISAIMLTWKEYLLCI